MHAELWQWAYAIINVILTGSMTFFGIMILKHFQEHREIAVTSFFLRNESIPAFKVMTVSLLFFATVTFMVAFGIIPRFPWYEFSITVLYTGLAYFMYTVWKITRHPGNGGASVDIDR